MSFSTSNYHEEKAVYIIVDKDKKEWFKGRDVCEILGFKNYHDALEKKGQQSV